MAPKGKTADKGKAKDAGADKGGAKQKGAQSINVRHILCEKHAKKEEAVAKLNAGSKFDEVRLLILCATVKQTESQADDLAGSERVLRGQGAAGYDDADHTV